MCARLCGRCSGITADATVVQNGLVSTTLSEKNLASTQPALCLKLLIALQAFNHHVH